MTCCNHQMHRDFFLSPCVYVYPGPAFGWGERGTCPGRWLRGGAEKAVTDRPHVNTKHFMLKCFVLTWFPHLQTKRFAKDFFFNLVVLVLAYSDVFWRLHMYIHVMLTRDVPTVSSVNSLVSQHCKASHFFLKIFMYWGGGGRKLFALPRLSHGQRPALCVSEI
jgi:hypothetical protein